MSFSTKKKLGAPIAVVLAGIAAALYGFQTHPQFIHTDYIYFHFAAEFFGIVVGFGIFLIGWNARKHVENDYLLVLAVNYLFVSFLSLIHTLAYKGMNFFPGISNNEPTQIWIATRYLESISFLIAPIFLRRRLHFGAALFIYASVTGAILYTIFVNRAFPDCLLPVTGLTRFKIISEYMAALVFAASLGLLYVHGNEFHPRVLRMLSASLVLAIATEFCFTLYSDPYDLTNFLGHLAKISSVFFIHKALVVTGINRPLDLMMHNLQQQEQKYRGIFDQAGVGIAEVTSLGVITLANQRLSEKLGYSPDELRQRTLYDLAHPEDIGFARSLLANLQSDMTTEWRLLRKDGQTLWCAMTPKIVVPDEFSAQEDHDIILVVQDITQRKEAELALRELTETLEKRVEERTAEANERARQLQEMSEALNEAEQRERQRVAALLHDHVQQLLVATRMTLVRAKKRIPEGTDIELLLQADNLIEQCIGATRSLTVQLCPPIVGEEGLRAGLFWLSGKMKEEYGLDIHISIDEQVDEKLRSMAVPLYQSIRELLFNVVKHASVNQCEIRAVVRDNNDIQVVVEDHGRGFDLGAGLKSESATGFGLQGLQRRLRLQGAYLEAESYPGRGTCMRITIPPSIYNRDRKGEMTPSNSLA